MWNAYLQPTKGGWQKFMSDRLCNGTASVCTNSWQHYCSSYMYSENLFVAQKLWAYEHRFQACACLWFQIVLRRCIHCEKYYTDEWYVHVDADTYADLPQIALCTTICWTTQWPIPKEFPPTLCLPFEFYGLQQKHNFIEANFIGKYGDERRCKSSTNYIIVAVMYRILDAFWFECHWISSGPYFGIVNT